MKRLISFALILAMLLAIMPFTVFANAAGTPVKITTQPKNVSVQSGKVAKVTVLASGEGLTYKWYFKDRTHSKFYLTNSFKSNSYSVEMNGTRASRQVYCVITDKYGNSVKTKTVNLGMAVKITKQPATVAVQSGQIAKVTVSASGEGRTYKWYFKDRTATKFSLTNSFKGDSYYVTMNGTRYGRQVYCVITDKYGNSVKTKTVTLGLAVKITKQPASVKVEDGVTAKVSVTASGEGKTYKWYFKDKNATKFTLTNSFKSNTYSVTMNSTRAGRQVYCVITDKYGNSVKTKTVTLDMEAWTFTNGGDKTIIATNGDETKNIDIDISHLPEPYYNEAEDEGCDVTITRDKIFGNSKWAIYIEYASVTYYVGWNAGGYGVTECFMVSLDGTEQRKIFDDPYHGEGDEDVWWPENEVCDLLGIHDGYLYYVVTLADEYTLYKIKVNDSITDLVTQGTSVKDLEFLNGGAYGNAYIKDGVIYYEPYDEEEEGCKLSLNGEIIG